MTSDSKFLRRVRIHGGECGAVARALHHEVKTVSLPAVKEKFSFTTNERKSMNNKTSFKRIALAVVVALGFGVLSTGPTQAVPFSHTLTIDSATDSAFRGETAIAVLTNLFSSNVAAESTTIRYTCSTAVGNTCPTPKFYQGPNSDTSNVNAQGSGSASTETNVFYSASTWTDSIVSLTAPARSVTSVKAEGFASTGTYTYTFYTTYQSQPVPTNPSVATITGQSVTWTVTVSNPSNRQLGSASTARIYISSDGAGGEGTATAYDAWQKWGAASDSAIVANKGTTSVAVVGTAFIRIYNSAGDTAVAVTTGGLTNSAAAGTVDDSITVDVTGPGYVSSNVAPTTTGNFGKSATINSINRGAFSAAAESLVILSDGTAGAATLTFKNGANTVLATKTVTFTGGIASVSQAFFVNAETTVSYTGTYADTVTVSAYVKDSAGTVLKNSGGLDRNLYLFSSDTAVVGDINSASLPSGRVSTCTIATATGLWTCKGDIRESGTVTLTLRDSLTVTASTVSFVLDTVTVVGNTLKTMTASYDKTTYAPGERAVITIQGLDTQGKALSGRGNDSGTMNKTYASAWVLVNTSTYSHTVSNASPYCGSVGVSGGNCNSYTPTTYSPFKETGLETVVVTMPTTGGAVSYEFRSSSGKVLATISATVVNPLDALVAAAEAAAKKAGADAEAAAKKAGTDAEAAAKKAGTDAVAAAEAATDAAAEAIDAANAATDAANLAAEAADAATVAAEEARDAAVAAAEAAVEAREATVAAAEATTDAAAEAIDAANAATEAANLAAEAADAATVAAEEARDAADAATAAVEELATQVATLMAALKAQITTLANTVAKIAKKVKA
jgi:hypothetical protein